jgi:hypothetical protein
MHRYAFLMSECTTLAPTLWSRLAQTMDCNSEYKA